MKLINSIKYNKYTSIKNIKNKNIYNIPVKKIYKKKDIWDAAITSRVLIRYDNVFDKFKLWLKTKHNLDKNYPSLKNIINNKSINLTNRILKDWMTYEFNTTHNIGDTLKNKINAILHGLGRLGYCITCDFLPGIGKLAKGFNHIAEHALNKNVRVPKRPILNIMMDRLFNIASDFEKFAILFQFKFCLRSEHFCIDYGEYLMLKHLQFIPNILNPSYLAIRTNADKNHHDGPKISLDRTIGCSCNSSWPNLCIVHMAQKMCAYRWHNQNQAVVRSPKGEMDFNTMLKLVKRLVTKIGLNEDFYGTHSLRSGGTTELHMDGWETIEIQQFVHWENIKSIFRYVRPNNPDLEKFGHSSATYKILRDNQKDKRMNSEEYRKQLMIQLNNVAQQRKMNYGKRAKCAIMHHTQANASINKNYTSYKEMPIESEKVICRVPILKNILV